MSSTPFQPETLVGSTLDGRYRLVSHIASGGMGAIFRSEHVHLRKDVAVKVLRPDLSASPDLVERFRREAEIAATLEHENIVRVTDFGRSPEGWLFLAMEYLEGESLFERLRRDGPMSPEAAVPILVQVCRGLEAAHARGVVHRDLKPENIFLVGAERPLAKILDFGIAKISDPATSSDTSSGMVVGTPEYLSPEQAMGVAIDGRADVYAVGLMAWRMLVGRHPFGAADPRGLVLMQATRPVPSLVEVRPDLAAWPALVEAVSRACAKDVQLRTAGAGVLGDELAGSVDVPMPGPRPPNPPPTPVTPLRSPVPTAPRPTITVDLPRVMPPMSPRRRLALAGAAAAILAGAVLGAWGLLRARPAERAAELLAQGRPEQARDLLAGELPSRPNDARLRALLGRALSRIPGQAQAAVDAYAAAAAIDPAALDRTAYADLALALGQERMVSEKAAQLLARGGSAAVPALLAAAAGSGAGAARLRALEVARGLGVESRLDRVRVYGALLGDADCDVRKGAARRLGELGNPAALPRLVELAQARRDEGPPGAARRVPVCGAAEAAQAVARIEQAARQ